MTFCISIAIICAIAGFTIGYFIGQLNNNPDYSLQSLHDQLGTKIIPPTLAKEMFDIFTADHVPLISTNKPPTRHVSCSFNKFKQYLQYLDKIDQLIKNDSNIPQDGINDIRIYFAKLPEESTFETDLREVGANNHQNDVQSNYQGRNTVFILPTVLNKMNEVPFVIKEQNGAIGLRFMEDFDSITTNYSRSSQSVITYSPKYGSILSDNHLSTILDEVSLTPPPN